MADRYQLLIEVDERGAVQGISRVGQSLDGLDRTAAKASDGAGRSIGAMQVAIGNLAADLIQSGIDAAIGFIGDSFRAFDEGQRATATLTAALDGLGMSYEELGSELEGRFAATQRATRYGDEQQARSLATLIGVTNDYDASLTGLQASMDLAAGRQMDLETAADLVGKAIAGNTSTLSRYGVVLSESEKKMLKHATATERAAFFADEFHERFGTAAARDLETVGGRIDQLTNYFGDFQEAIGEALSEEVWDTSVVDAWIDVLLSLTDNVGLFVLYTKAGMSEVGMAISAVVAAVAGHIAQQAQTVASFARLMTAGREGPLSRAAASVQEFAATIRDDAANAVVGLSDQVEELTDKIVNYDRRTEDAGTTTQRAAKEIEELGEKATKTKEKFGDLGERLQRVMHEFWRELEGGAGLFEPGGTDEYERWATEVGTVSAEAFIGAVDAAEITLVPAATDEALRLDALALEMEAEWDTFGDRMGDAVAGGLTDALIGVFSGDDLADVWGDWVSTSTWLFAQEFQSQLSAGITQGDWSGFSFSGGKPGTGWVAGAGMVGGALGQYGAQSGNQTVGAAGGALSGAAQGFALGGWVGAAVGAVVGGVLGYLGSGGTEEQTTGFTLGPGGVSSLRTAGHQYYGEQQRELFGQQVYAAYQDQLVATLDTMRLFGRQGMIGLLGTQLPTWGTGTGAGEMATGSADQWLRMLTGDILPDIFADWAESTIGQGLAIEGVSFEARQSLFAQLGELPGADRQQALRTYIQAVVQSGELLAQADWGEFTRLAELDTMGQFGEQVTTLFDDLALMREGMELLDLPDVAAQALEAESAIESAMQTWLGLLQQVNAQEEAMHRGFASLREQITLGGMTDTEQVHYYEQQIRDLTAQLATASYDEVGQITSDIQGYARALMDVLGEDLYAMMPTGGTWADWLMSILGQAEGAAGDVYQATRDQIHEALDEAATELERWRELLGIGADTLQIWRDTVVTGDENWSGSGSTRGGGWEPGQDPDGKPVPWEELSEWAWDTGEEMRGASDSMRKLVTAIESQGPPVVNVYVNGSLAPLIDLITQVAAGGASWKAGGDGGIS